MEVKYRFATLDDAYGIAYVAAHSWKETYSGFMPDEYLDYRINNVNQSVEKTKKFLENHDTYLVATINDKVVGICYYDKSQNNDYPDSGLLGALYVLEEYQNQGIGKQLFSMAVSNLNKDHNSMYLECLCGNPTLGFYEHFGGKVKEKIDYPISNFSVKADIIYYDNLENTNNLLKQKDNKKR